MVAWKMRALELPASISDNDPTTVFAGVPKLPPAVPPLQLWPVPGVVTVPLTLIEPDTKVVVVGKVSVMLMLVAVAPPVALVTEMQYSTTAPGIDL